MPPKRGKKRKTTDGTTTSGDTTANDNVDSGPLLPPDRATWPGWVEMESEPAFFNVMLKDMGVKGVRVQEVYDLDDAFLAMLPQPVHALIFLFRYRETETEQKAAGTCPKDVWFANQTPDFACATFALLNIVNNIPGLNLGAELRKFKDFTQDMDPLSRGDAVDSFDFVKRIHNSFARENDLLQADMHLKGKANKAKKRQALAKARETREAKKAEKDVAIKTPLKEKSLSETAPTRASGRKKKSSPKRSPKGPALEDDSDDDFETPTKANIKKTRKPPKDGTPDVDQDDFKSSAKTKGETLRQSDAPRRSKREPKPRKDVPANTTAEPAAEEGFHFAAYMPINGHVWKLDGLDRFPQDMGSFSEDDGGDWMHVAQPALMGRMAQYEASEIQFNLMAIVHDPIVTDRTELLENVKALQTIDKKLDELCEDWRSMEGAETKKDVVTRDAPVLGITEADVEATTVQAKLEAKLEKEDDLLKLTALRQDVIRQQAGLRANVRDSVQAAKGDDDKAKHRRHDYGAFVRGWLGALAEQEILSELVEG